MTTHLPRENPAIRRRACLGLGLAGLVGAWPAHAAVPLSTLLNRSAHCRSLSLRCAKLYLQVHLGVLPENSHDLLESVQRALRSEVQHIAQAGLTGESAGAVDDLQRHVDPLVAATTAEATRSAVLSVSQQSDKAYAAADKLVEAIQRAAKQPQARLIEVAARIRGRSQRLARNYFLGAAGHDQRALHDQIQADRKDFTSALDDLDRAPLSTPSIRNELGLVHSQWTFFEAALAHKPDMESMRNIATTSDRIHEVGDSLTALYDAALRDLLGHVA